MTKSIALAAMTGVLIVQACSADETPSIGSTAYDAGIVDSDSPLDSSPSDAGTMDESRRPCGNHQPQATCSVASLDVSTVTSFTYERAVWGGTVCGDAFLERLTFDLATNTVRKKVCNVQTQDASARYTDETIPVDGVAARATLTALRVTPFEELADGGCSGFDGEYYRLFVNNPNVKVIGVEYNCSGPLLDLVALEGFDTAVMILYKLAGL